jgi:cobalt/nickel transport protein
VRGAPTRLVLAALLLAALLLAGVLSVYASSSPDGLERVAEDHGFLDTAEQHAAADSPLADYQASGVEDSRLAGGDAGVVGALVVLVLAGGLTFVLRRRGASRG